MAFKLTVDERERLVAPPATPLERLGLALGREAAAEMLPIAWEAGELRVHGHVSSPAVGRSRRDAQYFYLNRRTSCWLPGRLPPARTAARRCSGSQ